MGKKTDLANQKNSEEKANFASEKKENGIERKEKRSFTESLTDTFNELTNQLTTTLSTLYKVPLSIASTLIFSGDQLKKLGGDQLNAMRETGAYLQDLRQVTGLTLSELSEAIELSDQSLLKAAESGTATLSFELILRLSALLARHDPLPFIMQLTRSYNPDLWKLLENWGIGKIPLQLERERQFINILRKSDDARALNDEQFERLLTFTEATFDLGMSQFIAKPKIDDEK